MPVDFGKGCAGPLPEGLEQDQVNNLKIFSA